MTTFSASAQWYAWIDFDGPSMNLQVRISTSPAKPAAAQIQATVNIYAILGQTTMVVGFSGATGGYFQTNSVYAWEFLVAGIRSIFFCPLPYFCSDHLVFDIGQRVINYGFLNSFMTLIGNATMPGYLILTTSAASEGGAAYCNTAFTYYRNGATLNFGASFTFIIDQPHSPAGDGMTFVVSVSLKRCFLSLK